MRFSEGTGESRRSYWRIRELVVRSSKEFKKYLQATRYQKGIFIMLLCAPFVTYPDGNSEQHARHCVTVARHLGADIDALLQLVSFPKVSSALGDLAMDIPSLVKEAKGRSQDRLSMLLSELKKEASSRGASLSATNLECYPPQFGELVADQARYRDLSLIGLQSGDPSTRSLAEAVLFGSGRPTLLLPEGVASIAFEHVMVAWDGSRVAVRAVADATPFLTRAKDITIATVTDEKALPGDGLGERLAHYLSQSGIQSRGMHFKSEGLGIAESLQSHALSAGAGLLIMGAFGHSRVRDFVLGGATSGVLKNLRLPTLLSH